MKIKNTQKTLINFIFSFIFVLFVVGCGEAPTATVTDTTGEQPPPVVNTPAVKNPIISTVTGSSVQVTADLSLPSLAVISSYSWSIISKPDLSSAVLSDSTIASPSFSTDIVGSYLLSLDITYTIEEGDPLTTVTITKRINMLVVATENGTLVAGKLNHSGLPSDCSQCHNAQNNESKKLIGKSADHIATSDTCQSCHTPSSFKTVTAVDHNEVFGNCSECHNNAIAVGKSNLHLETTQECDSCHSTKSFFTLDGNGRFDHTNITSGCSACHTGVVAVGKNTGHIQTQDECNVCHLTDSFIPAISVDHSLIKDNCVSCHGTAINPDPYPNATKKIANHPTTSIDCSTCHKVDTFELTNGFNHAILSTEIQSCMSCHDGSRDLSPSGKPGAIGKDANHIVTSSDCGSCHKITSFIPSFIDHTGPDVVGNRCDSCHGVNATGKSVTHMPTIEDCSVCHTPGTFKTGSFDHVGIVDNCESCHNNTITLGKLPNHIPTAQDCIVCHSTTNFTPSTFTHTGITNNCSSCHDGNSAKGKSNKHLPTSDDCSTCHTPDNFDTFSGVIFDHVGIDSTNCALCHNGVIAIDKKAKTNHIPASNDCSTCHIDTTHGINDNGGFKSSIFLTDVHANIITGCGGCHNTILATGKLSNHVPTLQDCYLCHVKLAFTPASNFTHNGISDNCSSCHNGNFITNTSNPKAKSIDHPATSDNCGNCHNTTAFTPAIVDHNGPSVIGKRCDSCHGISATGMHAAHIVTNEDCSTCHQPGNFKNAVFNHDGITNNCSNCHGDTPAANAVTAASKKLSNHVPTTEDCSVCHNTITFSGAQFNHSGITNNCQSCHDGNTALGKNTNHVPTNDDCVTCHNTSGFIPATFAHTGIVDNCQSCHNGTFAQGKSNNHVITNQDCSVCHATSTFKGAGYDHTGIVDNCESCHVNGGIASGKAVSTNHIQPLITDSCHLCHSTSSFKGGNFDHNGVDITGGCSSCHNNVDAIGKSNTHFVTIVECDNCHTPNGWAPINYTHNTLTGKNLGNHNANLSCKSCHKLNNETISFPFPQYAPLQDTDVFCAACHAKDFKSEGDHIGGKNGTVTQNKDCAGSGCHKVSDRKF